MYEDVDIRGKSFRQHDLTCPDCRMPLKLRAARQENLSDPVRPFYSCTGFPGCDTTHPANPQGDPLGELVVRPLREARRRAWRYFKGVIETHGKQKAQNRLRQLFHVNRTSQLSIQQCEQLCHLIAMREINRYPKVTL